MVQALRTSLRYGGLRQGGLQPGLGNDDIFATASLDLNFAVNKNLGTLVDATTGTNLIDFSRASSGTYVGSDGLIKTATTNLLLRSEEFDQTWIHPNATVSPDTTETVSPIGDNSADKITSDAGTVTKNVFQSISAITGDYVFSVYAKKGTNDFIQFYYGGTGVHANFDISTGVSISTSGTASIVEAGGGWYRCVHSFAAVSNTSVLIALVDSISATRGAPTSNTNSVYLWGAQLEQSSTVGEYVKTTSTINSAPRFDHDPTTGESLGLLVEEQRVNYCLQSEAFGTSPWSASNVTVTANTETSPASTLTADTLAATGANGTVTQPVTTTAIEMTFSVYLKRKTGTGNIDITADGTTWVTQTINDTTWTRCIVTQTAVAGTSNPGIRIVTSGDEVYAWGGQYE